jgi:hypothetical protein
MSTSVLFFGGYNATENQVKSWVASAQGLRSDVDFRGFPWPSGAASDDRSAVAGFRNAGLFKAAVKAVEASTAETVYLVGHSSGCAIANAVDEAFKDHDKIVLVSLDGFAPSKGQLARPSTQVWAAECEGVKSRNYHKGLKGRLKVYPATDCKTMWALHFSVVNTSANDADVPDVKGGWKNGYVNCRANLCWL